MIYNDYRRYFPVLLAMLVALPVYAQKVYTLDECRLMALQNNVKVRNASNNVETARQERKEAFTRYFPNVSASGMGIMPTRDCCRWKWLRVWVCHC